MSSSETPAPDRTVVLVDLENALTLTPQRCEVAALRATLEALHERGYLIEFAASHWFAKQHVFDFPFGRWQQRSGEDGADDALIDIVRLERLARRCDSVLLFSGDGKFSHSLATLAAAGVRTTVVARRGSLSRALQLAAHTHLFLDDAARTWIHDESDFGDAA